MGIMPNGKIITFFDESFGGDSEMTEEHYIIFWETILKVAEQERNSTIVIKPKGSENYKLLSQKFKEEYLVTLDKISKMKNIYFIDEKRWSFIEAVGVSDVVVTQGMTTSGTVAIICGIEGLYLDQFGYEHEFSRLFKDRIVFDNPEKLLDMIHRIVRGEEVPSKDIPEGLLREFDEYSDDRGIDLLRDILSGFRERCTV
jgi:polysaccharide biosynthesis PFTS motif protein